MTKVITVGNFKGGVGKTTTCVMLSYLLQKEGHKTLLLDFDPQANATSMMYKTFDKGQNDVEMSLNDGLKRSNHTLKHSIMHLTDNLDLIPSNWDLAQFPSLVDDYPKKERSYVLKYTLDEIKNDYDFVLIDTPPTIGDYTNEALFACDFFLVILQTQMQAYESSMQFIQYAIQLHDDHNLNYDWLGIVPYLVDKRGTVDQKIIKSSKKEYGDVMTQSIVYNRQRIKRYGLEGIKPQNGSWTSWDDDVFNMYHYLLGELLGRIKRSEESNNE